MVARDEAVRLLKSKQEASFLVAFTRETGNEEIGKRVGVVDLSTRFCVFFSSGGEREFVLKGPGSTALHGRSDEARRYVIITDTQKLNKAKLLICFFFRSWKKKGKKEQQKKVDYSIYIFFSTISCNLNPPGPYTFFLVIRPTRFPLIKNGRRMAYGLGWSKTTETLRFSNKESLSLIISISQMGIRLFLSAFHLYFDSFFFFFSSSSFITIPPYASTRRFGRNSWSGP